MRAGFLLCAVVLLAGTIGTASGGSGLTALGVIDQQIGNGAVARNGSEVAINYTGWLYDENAPDHHGAKVDSSLDRGQPIRFTLGEGKGMHVGGKRTLLIPSRLANRSHRVGKVVPPNASLVFDIELLACH